MNRCIANPLARSTGTSSVLASWAMFAALVALACAVTMLDVSLLIMLAAGGLTSLLSLAVASARGARRNERRRTAFAHIRE